MSVTFTLNGKATTLDADPDMPLLWALREVVGSARHEVRLRHRAVWRLHRAHRRPGDALVRDAALGGRGQARHDDRRHQSKAAKAVQTAWIKLQVPQCGYCQSGQIMSATALLEQNPKPNDADIDDAMRRKHLPLFDLSPHPRCDPRGRSSDGG